MDAVAYRQFLELERDHWWFRGRRRSYFTILERFVPAGTKLRTADVGCGVGGMLGELERRFGPPIGVDCDPQSVRRCRERGFPRTVVGRADALPLARASMDLLTYFDCIEHLDDDVAAVREAARVLRPGAIAFFSVPAYQFLYSNNDRVAHHKRRYTRGRLLRTLRAGGLEPLWSTYVNVVLFPVILPTLLAIKARERLFPKEGDTRTNLSHRPPRWANGLLASIFGGEGTILSRVRAPFGHSLVAVARKPR